MEEEKTFVNEDEEGNVESDVDNTPEEEDDVTPKPDEKADDESGNTSKEEAPSEASTEDERDHHLPYPYSDELREEFINRYMCCLEGLKIRDASIRRKRAETIWKESRK